jgi:hypothetical protein
LSREELAVRAGVSWAAISQIEAGRRSNLRPSTLRGLADTLNVTTDYLLGRARTGAPLLEHHALLYGDGHEFVDAAMPFVTDGVERSEPVLVVTGKGNLKSLRRGLGRVAGDVQFADSGGWYSSPAAALEGFRNFALDSIDAGAQWVRILGEPVWQGRSAKDVKTWTAFEALFNYVFGGLPMSALCSYDTRTIDRAIVDNACVTHTHTLTAAGLEKSAAFADPGDFIVGQQTY